jgi:hypothetical protein
MPPLLHNDDHRSLNLYCANGDSFWELHRVQDDDDDDLTEDAVFVLDKQHLVHHHNVARDSFDNLWTVVGYCHSEMTAHHGSAK